MPTPPSFRIINVGDEVVLVSGKYAGLRGKVKQKRPRAAPFAVQILVSVDLTMINDSKKRIDQLRDRFKKWQSVGSWKRIV